MCMIWSGLYFSFWAWPSKHLKLGLGFGILRSSIFLLESCVVLNTDINKVWGNWTLSANLDICLHLQVNTFPFKLKCPSSLPPPNWSFKWPVRPSSCDNTILPSPDIFLYLHSSLGLFLGLCTTSGIYQHEACWKMDGSEKSERRVKLSWKCLAFP